jgi:hypothetical protein
MQEQRNREAEERKQAGKSNSLLQSNMEVPARLDDFAPIVDGER